MNKLTVIFKTQLLIYFTYRLSFVLWRVRNVLSFIIIFFLWNSIFTQKTLVFSYSAEKMLTYILLVNFMSAIVLSTRTTDIASEIVSGDIINYLTKPISFLSMITTRELADKTINTAFATLEVSLLIYLLQPPLLIQTNILTYAVTLLALVIGAVIAFFISFSLSLVAFWTAETWAPRFVYFILISLLAGTAFPLDILPPALYNFLLLTPFPYLVYLPSIIYLNGITQQTIFLCMIGMVWAIGLYLFTKFLWNKGMREFSFYGR